MIVWLAGYLEQSRGIRWTLHLLTTFASRFALLLSEYASREGCHKLMAKRTVDFIPRKADHIRHRDPSACLGFGELQQLLQALGHLFAVGDQELLQILHHQVGALSRQEEAVPIGVCPFC